MKNDPDTGAAGPSVGEREPARAEILGLAALAVLACIWAAHAGPGYWSVVKGYGDNADYAAISRAIRAWDLNSLGQAKHFWGLSYAASAVAALIRVTDLQAVMVVSLCSSAVALLLAYRIWGGWTTLFFLVIDWNWLQLSSYGGAIPLFTALVFGALLAASRERWALAAALGALATTVQPLGLFVLLPILLVEQWRRKSWLPNWSPVIAAGILVAFVLPFAIRFHDPLAAYHGYQHQDWFGRGPITYPLGAVVENFKNGANFGTRLTEYVKVGYVAAHLAALGLLGLYGPLRKKALERPLELAFVGLYSTFILLYNSPDWALVIHARLLVPLLPTFLWAFDDWIPKRRWLAYSLGALSLGFACVGTLKIHTL